MNINIHIDVSMNFDMPPPSCPPRPRLRTAPAWGGVGWAGVGWGDINIHIDINMKINFHIIIVIKRHYW